MRILPTTITLFLLLSCEEKDLADIGTDILEPDGLAGDSDRPFAPEIEDFSTNEDDTVMEYDGNDLPEMRSSLSLAFSETILHVQHTDVLFTCEPEFINEIEVEDTTLKVNYTAEPLSLEAGDCFQYSTLNYRIDMTDAPLGRYTILAEDASVDFEMLENMLEALE